MHNRTNTLLKDVTYYEFVAILEDIRVKLKFCNVVLISVVSLIHMSTDNSKTTEQFFKLKGDTLVLIDWANIFHAQEKNGWKINLAKLYSFLINHEHVSDVMFFYGTDTHEKSKLFLQKIEKIGYRVTTKEVKYVPVTIDHLGNLLKDPVLRRKCDFDVEISQEILLHLDKYRGFILFSGDGDYAPIFDTLRDRGKQSVLVFPQGSLGREYNEMPERRKAIFLCDIERIRLFIRNISHKNIPRSPKRPGRE